MKFIILLLSSVFILSFAKEDDACSLPTPPNPDQCTAVLCGVPCSCYNNLVTCGASCCQICQKDEDCAFMCNKPDVVGQKFKNCRYECKLNTTSIDVDNDGVEQTKTQSDCRMTIINP